MRVGVIGAGYWGPNIVRNLHEAPGAEAVAVADLSKDRLDVISKRFPAVRVTTNYRELIDDPSIDAICIVTPVGTHRKLAEEAFAAGKHVFVEKPLAATVSDAEAIVRAGDRAGKTLMVGHTFVYNPAVVAVKEILESDGIGRVHYIDSQRVNLGLEDVVFLQIGFPSGAIAHAHLSWLAPSKLRTMIVIGSQKMVVYDDVQGVEKVKIYDQGVDKLESDELRRSYRAGDIHSPRVPMTEALQVEMRHFIECVRDGTKPRSDGEAGLTVVRVLELAMRSLRSGGARVAYRLDPVRA